MKYFYSVCVIQDASIIYQKKQRCNSRYEEDEKLTYNKGRKPAI